MAEPDSPARRRIEEVALKLFAAQGYRGTPVKEIMLECGLTPGAMYNHFQSKDELLFTILRKLGDEFTVMIKRGEQAADPDDPAQLLFNVVEAMALFALRHPDAVKVANVDYVELSEAYLKEEVEFRRTNRRRIEKIIEAGIATGQFVIPIYDNVNEIKLTATALANVAIRLSDAAGPHPSRDIAGLARFHAQLALRIVTRRSA
ncbi:TetR/AcrR family transcriptional regulator [Actinocrispum wychmicini]|uniref:TetR family transcriptional regulator n=1 Tax=Actinocrispum wychmicini TaxID=1213861 RepID=A0A4R2JPK2_9PSEU|nr:TetR/AcrR family transcriptional regulator [Actinocrispum wychmicini]TCO62101.1 TetR family transcriptional regulator [Actinocrispum wychmicini]